jgi:hypothetical protein
MRHEAVRIARTDLLQMRDGNAPRRERMISANVTLL